MPEEKTQREQARSLVESLVAAYNEKDRDRLADLYAEDISLWSALGAETNGRDEVLRHIDVLFRTLPDEVMSLDTMVTDGESTVIEVTSTGTNEDGSAYQIQFTEVLEIVDGKFTEIRTYIDPVDVEKISVGH
jgi:uncharacterized protein (TIGR02246 family)